MTPKARFGLAAQSPATIFLVISPWIRVLLYLSLLDISITGRYYIIFQAYRMAILRSLGGIHY